MWACGVSSNAAAFGSAGAFQLFRVAADSAVSWIETAKVSGPTLSSSPLLSLWGAVISVPLTSVPFRLPRSATVTSVSVTVISVWRRLTSTLLGRRWHDSSRPIRNTGKATGMTFPSGLPETTIRFTFSMEGRPK